MSYLSEIRKYIGCQPIISVRETTLGIGIYLAVQWSFKREVATHELKEEIGLESSWFELIGVLLN